ncbi:MAG: hypothetical protein A2504_00740 [Bdellovibrionales bacterium RIFOXYD12_FULL_39_22]|nr:MAG: hypothetical protein A2385_03360 [Bdellovibrionales bacterium RIFOXYB1_FULL_39_21]OFZ42635.1 MAG: hypothetical protein A2485_09945 [Bdellovibrionales bacterium RIFOXYC12_FULL_39_17]OFZ47097.1 MAG: hypothetical protein A2404_15350 [Bdellovibrionales bacterium RIFOXYC1_FULL_39_130]OFZ72382.1 MAG: hypothetical protein A2451_12335 [Bdellovibrionales bacterium RIFOXYC2_FULL_39_8]OFZ75345.1 MAG: hypothetical protein A2560_14125 [Bdellovibrionales bacterium RIFOXYD1_FULL_39_84]OFZ93296.1 MAG:
MRKNFIFIVALLFIVSELHAAALASLLARTLERGLVATYERAGFSRMAAEQAEESVRSATQVIMEQTKGIKGGMSEANIKKAFAFNPRLSQILDMDEAAVSEAELVDLINISALEAELKGADFVCGQCVQSDLFARGVRGVLRKTPSSMKGIASKAANMSHSKLLSEIKTMAKKLNLSKEDYDAFVSLPDEARKSTFYALDLMKNGTRAQKELGAAIDKFNRAGGKTYYSQNKLINLLTEDLKGGEVASWVETLNKLSKEPPIDAKEGRVANLRAYFEKKAAGDPKKEADLDFLYRNGCFGIAKR